MRCVINLYDFVKFYILDKYDHSLAILKSHLLMHFMLCVEFLGSFCLLVD